MGVQDVISNWEVRSEGVFMGLGMACRWTDWWV